MKREWSKKEPKLLFWTLIQCDINPYRHHLSLPGDLVPWVLLFSVTAKTYYNIEIRYLYLKWMTSWFFKWCFQIISHVACRRFAHLLSHLCICLCHFESTSYIKKNKKKHDFFFYHVDNILLCFKSEMNFVFIRCENYFKWMLDIQFL